MFKMADEEKLSDAELRKELKRYGETPGPITASTRSIWVRKLTSLKAGNDTMIKSASPTSRSRPRRSATPRSSRLAGFSSGEEDDMFSSPNVIAKGRDRRSIRRKEHHSKDSLDNQSKGATSAEGGNDLDSEHAPKTTDNNAYSKAFYNNEIKRRSRGCENDVDGSSDPSTRYRGGATLRSKETGVTLKGTQRKTRRGFSPGQAEALLMQDRVNQSRSSKDSYDGKRRSPGYQNHDGNDQEEELYVEFESSRDDFLDWLFQIPVLIVLGTVLACVIAVAVYIWSQPSSPPEIAFQGKNTLQKTNEFLKCLQQILGTMAGDADCGYRKSRYLPGKDIEQVAIDCFPGESIDAHGLVNSGLKAALLKGKHIFRIEDTNGNIVERNLPDTASVQITSNYAIRSTWCRVQQALYLIFTRLLILFAVLGSAMVTYYSWKRRWMLDDEETREMFILVDHIIDALRKHHEASQHEKELPPYLPIPHVRDMLIPPLERKKKARVWKKAVEFLSSTDSRIRVETQTIAGEDYDVWRWIGVLTPNLKQKNDSPNHLGPDIERGKYWQGPAFAKLEQVVRMPIVTPTPCLKIRCMHGGPTEIQDDWDMKIRDALLEKCSTDGAKILHIFVDKVSTEGCVYVKCDSLDSAGKAFRSIYANWFDVLLQLNQERSKADLCIGVWQLQSSGRLLVVKFVTLKRYHQRFPEALKATSPLEASGRFPSSLEWFAEDAVD